MRDAWLGLPGASRVKQGLLDLSKNHGSTDALLLLVARARLLGLGVEIPQLAGAPADPERALYDALDAIDSGTAHREFNALRREIVSFCEALESLQMP